jgi:hypothetical protein
MSLFCVLTNIFHLFTRRSVIYLVEGDVPYCFWSFLSFPNHWFQRVIPRVGWTSCFTDGASPILIRAPRRSAFFFSPNLPFRLCLVYILLDFVHYKFVCRVISEIKCHFLFYPLLIYVLVVLLSICDKNVVFVQVLLWSPLRLDLVVLRSRWFQVSYFHPDS